MTLPDPFDVRTAAVSAVGLIGGYTAARVTGKRPLGGLVLAAAGGLAARTWIARDGAGPAAALTAGYIAAFGLSHPLAKAIGAWPAVLTVTAAHAAAAHVVSDAYRR
ncbi:hypothetical protein [Georgenia deserti]|uniref:Uncharacterized protein n=1 Tax=Georgenia deserti TaxID=2093781 RepID=A0ABW4L010_9MICO|nr:hypothetical protein [Micromonosporaceae bacterium]